jgi:hypothetical protein
MDRGLLPADVQRAMAQVGEEGSCDIRYTVGADGKPKDVVPNCTPPAFNSRITDAVSKMMFKPGQKGGQPTDWPGMSMPLKLSKPQQE